jgi:hypothetical protein
MNDLISNKFDAVEKTNTRTNPKKKTPKKTPKKTLSKKRSTRKSSVVKRGRWQVEECVAFLQGFRMYGKGKWKAIAKLIPDRTTIQVKTHAQTVLKKIEAGEDVFSILEEHQEVEPTSMNVDHDDDDDDDDDDDEEEEKSIPLDEEKEPTVSSIVKQGYSLDLASTSKNEAEDIVSHSNSFSLPPLLLPRSFEAATTSRSPPKTPLPPTSTIEKPELQIPVSPLRVDEYVDSPNLNTPYFDLNDKDCDVKSAAHILLELSTSPSASNELSPVSIPMKYKIPRLHSPSSVMMTDNFEPNKTTPRAIRPSSTLPPPGAWSNTFKSPLVSLHPRYAYRDYPTVSNHCAAV